MKTRVAAAACVVVALLACKDSKPAANCNAKATPSLGFCFEYPKDQVESGKGVCKSFPGVWTDGPCDRTGALGVCKMSTGITKVFYPESGKTAEAAQVECGGKWVGPNE